ncbi:hypothetical protein L7F22_012065, partial [Adiantum nelumboides]|nr:hypothetical protein [Adiantum nelumboides]
PGFVHKDDIADTDVVDKSACLQDNWLFETLPNFHPGCKWLMILSAVMYRRLQLMSC